MEKNINQKKAWYKRVWVWIGIIIILGIIGAAANGGKTPTTTTTDTQMGTEATTKPPEAKEEESKQEKWDVDTAYAKLTDGMTKAEVESALGKTSDSCSETSAEYVGKIETCNYGGVGDNGMIMVQYQNEKMSTKSKTKF